MKVRVKLSDSPHRLTARRPLPYAMVLQSHPPQISLQILTLSFHTNSKLNGDLAIPIHKEPWNQTINKKIPQFALASNHSEAHSNKLNSRLISQFRFPLVPSSNPKKLHHNVGSIS
jgi:hypothetical protein